MAGVPRWFQWRTRDSNSDARNLVSELNHYKNESYLNVHTNHLVILLIAEADSVGLMGGPGFCISNRLPGANGAGGLLQASGCLWAGGE